MPSHTKEFRRIEETLKKVAAVLRDAEIPFALGGSLAAWARGGPASSKDLDFMIREQDLDRVLAVLAGAGLRTERPPEGWLAKAWDGDVMVDLIHHALGVPITDEVLDRAESMGVLSLTMRVLSLEDLLSSKLLALNEHLLDYEPILMIARAVREQVDWQEVRARTAQSPYARAFFALMDELDLDTGISETTEAAGPRRTRIRVVPPT